MKDLTQMVKDYDFQAFDGRDLNRLAVFLNSAQLGILKDRGIIESFKEVEPVAYTREAVMTRLTADLEFAFEKALGKRGLSAVCMWHVIRMWNTLLENGLGDPGDEQYTWYGLPYLKATALANGLDNPLGDDTGSEPQYGDEE